MKSPSNYLISGWRDQIRYGLLKHKSIYAFYFSPQLKSAIKEMSLNYPGYKFISLNNFYPAIRKLTGAKRTPKNTFIPFKTLAPVWSALTNLPYWAVIDRTKQKNIIDRLLLEKYISGLSVDDIGKLIGCSGQAVASILNQDRVLRDLCKLFKVK